MGGEQGRLTKAQFVAFLQRQADGSSFTRTLAARTPTNVRSPLPALRLPALSAAGESK